jgi:integrase
MSVEKRKLDSGRVVWRVRYREGGRNKAKVLGRKRDAEAFDAEIRRRKRTGEISTLDAGRQTLADFAEEWFRVHAEPNFSKATLESYTLMWDCHVLPRLGGFTLRELRSEVIESFASDLARVGVGPAARRRTLMILSSVLQRAEDWGRITANPVRKVRKPSGKRKRAVRPLAPENVEEIRARLLVQGRLRDATLVSVLAYAGLRPGEALALAWEHVRDSTILIERANSNGEIKDTKTEMMRTVTLLAPLTADLAQWRLASGRPDGSSLVFPNGRGELWSEITYRNWRRRVYQPTAEAVGVHSSRPYDLRHSFASLLIHEGCLSGRGRAPAWPRADSQPRHLRACVRGVPGPRACVCRGCDPCCSRRAGTPHVPSPKVRPWTAAENPCESVKPTPGFEPGTPSLRVHLLG